jgi:histidinol-phosphate aminotransferase
MTMTVESIVKPEVRQLVPYTLREYSYRHKLNQNENPFGFPDGLKEEFWERVRGRDWARYPDFHLREITMRIAEHAGVSPDMVLVGNGSNELIQVTLMATVTRGDAVVIPTPTFTLYALLSTVLGAEPVTVMLRDNDFALPVDEVIAAANQHRAKVIVLCSPNNPTGNRHPLKAVRRLIEECEALVVLDEAYREFCDQDFRPLLDDYDNVVLLRTFSKAWALAGARLGYLIASGALVHEVAKAKLPYSLNVFSETAALVALDHLDALERQVAEIRHQRDTLFAALAEMEHVHPYPSEANFILTRLDRSPAAVFETCLKHGLLVRNVSQYPGLAGHLRLSVGTQEENESLLRALADDRSRNARGVGGRET